MTRLEDLQQEAVRCRDILHIAEQSLERVESLVGELSDKRFVPKGDQWIGVMEACRICGVSRSTMNRLAASGRVEARHVGNAWRFPKSRVEDLTFLKNENKPGHAR